MEVVFLVVVWNCFVFSNDSDFFIFDIEVGYIFLFFLYWNLRFLIVKIFYCLKLVLWFWICVELIFLLVFLVGNDYVSEDLLVDFNGVFNCV